MVRSINSQVCALFSSSFIEKLYQQLVSYGTTRNHGNVDVEATLTAGCSYQ